VEWQPIVATVASLVIATTAVVTSLNAARANRPRLKVHLHKEADRAVRVSVANVGRHGQTIVAAGLVAGERDLSTTLVEADSLPHRVRASDLYSFMVGLAESKRAGPSLGQVTGAWVSTADGKRWASALPQKTPRDRDSVPRPMARTRITTAIFSVAIYALIWSFRPPMECITVVITSSNEKASLLQYIAKEYNSRPTAALLGLGRCEEVRVNRLESGLAATALARDWDSTEERPDVWTPASTSWGRLLSHDRVSAGKPDFVTGDLRSIAQSPLVIGMLQPKAERLGWLDKVRDKTWKEIIDLAKDPTVWAAHNSGWGTYRVTRTNPNVSTSGLHTLIAQYFIATGGWAISCAGVAAVLPDVQRMERSSFDYGGDSVRRFLEDLYRADAQGTALSFASAIPMEEAQLWQYNRGNPEFRWTGPDDPRPRKPPDGKLVALYPANGTLLADHPYIVLEAAWVSPEKKAVANRFLDYLVAPRQQALFREAGFRDERGQLGEGKDSRDGLDRDGPRLTVEAPAPASVRCIQDSWLRVSAGALLWPPAWVV
jgi:hypothetical protein